MRRPDNQYGPPHESYQHNDPDNGDPVIRLGATMADLAWGHAYPIDQKCSLHAEYSYDSNTQQGFEAENVLEKAVDMYRHVMLARLFLFKAGGREGSRIGREGCARHLGRNEAK